MESKSLAQKIGNKLQTDFKKEMDSLASVNWFHVLRLYDTTSARGSFLPAQPGDFLLHKDSKVLLIETKASSVHDSLRSCLSSNMKKAQAANLGLWSACKNKSEVVFAHYDSDRGKWSSFEVWEGEYVSTCRKKGKVLNPEKAIQLSTLKEVGALLVNKINGIADD